MSKNAREKLKLLFSFYCCRHSASCCCCFCVVVRAACNLISTWVIVRWISYIIWSTEDTRRSYMEHKNYNLRQLVNTIRKRRPQQKKERAGDGEGEGATAVWQWQENCYLMGEPPLSIFQVNSKMTFTIFDTLYASCSPTLEKVADEYYTVPLSPLPCHLTLPRAMKVHGNILWKRSIESRSCKKL